jgi:hypothetical protein
LLFCHGWGWITVVDVKGLAVKSVFADIHNEFAYESRRWVNDELGAQ